MKTHKLLLTGLFVLVAVATMTAEVAAMSSYPTTPHSGVPSIGTQFQASRTVQVAGFPGYSRHFYDYIAPARAGGFYGDTTAFITGLRVPIYAPVQPVYYTNYYQPVCGWPNCHIGGAGFPRARASQFPATGTPGGVFSY